MEESFYDNGSVLGTVEAKIHAVASQFEGVEYMFADFSQANMSFDGITKPTILYVLPARGTIRMRHSKVRDVPSVQLWFVCPSDFDFDGEENECRVEAMKRLGVRFIAALNESDLFEVIDDTDIEYNVAYDKFDENLTGIALYPQLVEREGVVLCGNLTRQAWKKY